MVLKSFMEENKNSHSIDFLIEGSTRLLGIEDVLAVVQEVNKTLFKKHNVQDGLDVRTNIYNDRNRFAVEIDTYQFRPEELEVKTMDDTLLIGKFSSLLHIMIVFQRAVMKMYEIATTTPRCTLSANISCHPMSTLRT